MNMRQMLGESGRTMSNMDRSMATNEPRFEDRPPELQIFTLNSSIDNLMKTYEMMVRNQDFQGAQQIADQIDQIEQQKIQIQNQPDPSGMDAINRMMQYKGMPVYPEELPFDTLPTDNTSDEISKILQSIAK
jgi:hypothetical protein